MMTLTWRTSGELLVRRSINLDEVVRVTFGDRAVVIDLQVAYRPMKLKSGSFGALREAF